MLQRVLDETTRRREKQEAFTSKTGFNPGLSSAASTTTSPIVKADYADLIEEGNCRDPP